MLHHLQAMSIGTSNPSFDEDVERFIRSNFTTDSLILDVGCGAGKYGRMLHDYPSKEAIEANPACIEKYPLNTIYNEVHQTTLQEAPDDLLKGWDLITMGDVLEHVTVEEAQAFLARVPRDTAVLVKVPLMAPRGASFGTHLEAHPQGDLTVENFLERYPDFIYLFGDTTNEEKRSSGQLRITTFFRPSIR